MKKSYIAPEIKTMSVDNVVMAATSGLTTSDTPATSLTSARSRYSSSWDDSEGDDLAWE